MSDSQRELHVEVIYKRVRSVRAEHTSVTTEEGEMVSEPAESQIVSKKCGYKYASASLYLLISVNTHPDEPFSSESFSRNPDSIRRSIGGSSNSLRYQSSGTVTHCGPDDLRLAANNGRVSSEIQKNVAQLSI